MPNIREYNPQFRQLTPTDRASQSWETAGRRVGPLYNQAAEDTKRAGQVLSDMERAKSWPFNIYALREANAQQVRQTAGNETTARGGNGTPSINLGGGHGGHGGGGGGGGTTAEAAANAQIARDNQAGMSSSEFAAYKNRVHGEASVGAAGMSRVAGTLVGGSGMENGVAVLRGGRGGGSDMENGVTVLRGGRGNVPGSSYDPGEEVQNDVQRQTMEDALRRPYDPGEEVNADVQRQVVQDYLRPDRLFNPREEKTIQNYVDKWNLKNPTEKSDFDTASKYLFPERFLPSPEDEAAVEKAADAAGEPSWISRGYDAVTGGIGDIISGIKDQLEAVTGTSGEYTAPIPDDSSDDSSSGGSEEDN